MTIDHDEIPTWVIQQDIRDTQAEIREYERKIPALRTLGDKMSVFKADAYVSEIRDREQFITKLMKLLDGRKDLTR